MPHAREQAKRRDVPVFIAERILRAGTVTNLEIEAGGAERWRVSGSDGEGRPVDVVVVEVSGSHGPYLRVITVIRTDE